MSETKQIELTIPSGWDEITVEQFQMVQQLDQSKFKSNINYLVSMISILCDIDMDILMSLGGDELTQITDAIDWVSTPPEEDKKEYLEVNDIQYKFKSNLNSLSVGEMVSIEQVIDMEELNVEMAFDVVLAILLREIKPDGTLEDFNADDFQVKRELFSQLKITDVIGSLLFFSDGVTASTNNTKGTSNKLKLLIKKTQKKLKN